MESYLRFMQQAFNNLKYFPMKMRIGVSYITMNKKKDGKFFINSEKSISTYNK